MSELVYLNGKLVPREEARIAALDYGFLYGYGLFETMRAYRGRVFRLEQHIGRLVRSAGRLGITVDAARLGDAVGQALEANHLRDARLRLAVSAGEGSPVPDPATCTRPTVLVVAVPFTPLPEGIYRRGYRAITASLRRNSRSPLASMKSASYLESLLARQEARLAGVDEALVLNERGLVAEASMSNVFVVRAGGLLTPGRDSGILPGVTRQAVLELAGELGLAVREVYITPEELVTADEAFLTNSVLELMPLVEVDGRPVGAGVPGGVTGRLAAAYRGLVARETGGAG